MVLDEAQECDDDATLTLPTVVDGDTNDRVDEDLPRTKRAKRLRTNQLVAAQLNQPWRPRTSASHSVAQQVVPNISSDMAHPFVNNPAGCQYSIGYDQYLVIDSEEDEVTNNTGREGSSHRRQDRRRYNTSQGREESSSRRSHGHSQVQGGGSGYNENHGGTEKGGQA